MQLVAYGAQDIYLTSNPQITFFKIVYRRHTNFSRETIEQTHTGTAAAGAQITVTISRNGDLVYKLYMECKKDILNLATAGDHVPSNIGHAMIDFAELEIGGQTIDKIYGHWMEVWARLTEDNPTGSVGVMNGAAQDQLSSNSDNVVATYDTASANASGVIIHPLTSFQRMACAGGVCAFDPNDQNATSGSGAKVPSFSVPFPFWFCKNAGNALPLIALQYHEVKLKLQFASTSTGFPADYSPEPKIWAEYIYLDTPERRRFAQVAHEYLIEQLQKFETTTQSATGGVVSTTTLDLNFNHPVKELIFTSDFDKTSKSSTYGYLPGWADDETNVTLKLNGVGIVF